MLVGPTNSDKTEAGTKRKRPSDLTAAGSTAAVTAAEPPTLQQGRPQDGSSFAAIMLEQAKLLEQQQQSIMACYNQFMASAAAAASPAAVGMGSLELPAVDFDGSDTHRGFQPLPYAANHHSTPASPFQPENPG